MFGTWVLSSDQGLRQAGQKGLVDLQNEASNQLVLQLTSDNALQRKAATEALIERYQASSPTISAVLKLFDERSFADLSPSAVIDAFLFLSKTDPSAWNKDQVQLAQAAVSKVENRGAGTQTKNAIQALNATLSAVHPALLGGTRSKVEPRS